MEQIDLPKIISWTCQFIRQEHNYDEAKEKQVCDTRIPQRSLVSPLLFLIYATHLYNSIKEWGGNPGFTDNITIKVQEKAAKL